MKVKISFVADVTVSGGSIKKDELIEAFELWLEDADTLFTDSLVDYVPEDCEFDTLDVQLEGINVR